MQRLVVLEPPQRRGDTTLHSLGSLGCQIGWALDQVAVHRPVLVVVLGGCVCLPMTMRVSVLLVVQVVQCFGENARQRSLPPLLAPAER